MVFAKEEDAYKWLDKLGISYQSYEHQAITTAHELTLSFPGQQVKNLLLKNKKKSQFYLLVLSIDKQADLGSLAEILGEKRLSFASEKDLEDLLHVPAGTVTPFGLQFDQEDKVQLLVDDELDRSQHIGFHPFSNSTTVMLAYDDFDNLMENFKHSIKLVSC
ncbi:YbaK/EbsC family protein [Streptococcus loxodontisalivarius]|uniref:Ala-tRNA(Pro) deacylase n=1 Tax=Streptococcus loxodontisalivarius TaxID=1349415 RepID=A0ABS2PPH8_9STRE|nr:YbaK/EbsC family protein [Streptococcus loxodontisalivarius]MBM7641781.1 Ala-tRNA(Pro) deacylase [Streptococcus loxodontisalivarius]